MKIGIIGAGHIGATIAKKLAAIGHDVKLANSKGPSQSVASPVGVGLQGLLQRDVVRAQLASLGGPGVGGCRYLLSRLAQPSAYRVAGQAAAPCDLVQRQLVALIHPSNLA